MLRSIALVMLITFVFLVPYSAIVFFVLSFCKYNRALKGDDPYKKRLWRAYLIISSVILAVPAIIFTLILLEEVRLAVTDLINTIEDIFLYLNTK